MFIEQKCFALAFQVRLHLFSPSECLDWFTRRPQKRMLKGRKEMQACSTLTVGRIRVRTHKAFLPPRRSPTPIIPITIGTGVKHSSHLCEALRRAKHSSFFISHCSRRPSAGFIKAARRDWKLIVTNAIPTDIRPARAKNCQPMSIRYANSLSHCCIR